MRTRLGHDDHDGVMTDLHRMTNHDDRPRSAPRELDRGTDRTAIVSLVLATAVMLIVYVALVDVDRSTQIVLAWSAAAGALAAAVAVHRMSTPTRQLPHPQKVRREQQHAATLTGVLGSVLLLLSYAAASDLDSWSEWVVFGVLVLVAVAAGVAASTRLR